jgi:PTS system ascorbate-specific IIA component
MSDAAPLSLRTALNEDSVQARVVVSSWEQAVQEVGRLMVGAGYVQEGYIEAMKRTIRELGPYSVIAPGIAMPHARPEDGVIKAGFALLTLATPVNFGNEANDPVDIVIGFAAKDKTSHIMALREIAMFFGDAKTVEMIRTARKNDQLAIIFQNARDHSISA